MPNAHWHHVRSKSNPADVLSRGCSAKELAENSLWWHGPPNLKASLEPWPKSTENLALSIEQS